MPLPAGDGLALPPTSHARQVIDAWKSGKSPNTVKTYAQALEDFRRFVKLPDLGAAAEYLVSRGQGEVNQLAFAYRDSLLQRRCAPGTVNVKISALASLLKVGRTLGVTVISIEIPRMRNELSRDVRGPPRDAVVKLIRLLEERAAAGDPFALRDVALVRLMAERGLRVSEATGTDLEHLDVPGRRLKVLRKGKRQREWVTLPASTMAAVDAWVRIRGHAAGPLFARIHTASAGAGRLSRQGIARSLKQLGKKLGLHLTPHQFRHAAVTAALDAGADIRGAMKFAGHATPAMAVRYDDCRQDLAGQVAELVAVPHAGQRRFKGKARIDPPPLAAMSSGPTAHSLALRRGVDSHHAKVTDDDVRAMRRRYAAGEGPTALGREYGLSVEAVRCIVKRLTWKHVVDKPAPKSAAPPSKTSPCTAEEARARGMNLYQWMMVAPGGRRPR